LNPVNLLGNAYPIARDPADIMSAIAVAAATGDVTPSEAAEIAKVVDGYVTAFQTPNWMTVWRAWST
jgi:hypothetical protein